MTSPVLVDIYPNDLNGQPNIPALVAAGLPWAGLGLKISEGTYYPGNNPTAQAWFKKYWPVARSAAGARYGDTWFRYGYHYFIVGEDPIAQAENALRWVDAAGGWGDGDLWLEVDLETSEQPPGASASQIVDGMTKFAERVRTGNGRAPILYAGSYVRDKGIKDHMGCQLLTTAIYGSTLPAHYYLDMGWTLAELFSWQYQGTESPSGPSGYPRTCPLGPGPLDLSAVTICNGATPDEQLAWIRDNRGK